MSMLELSMSLPIKVQNGGLFISRGIGSHPARQLHSWEIIFVEKGTLTIRENNEILASTPGKVYCSGRGVYTSESGNFRQI